MNDFFRIFRDITDTFPLTLEIYYSKRMDWVVEVYKKCCAQDYPNSLHRGYDALLFNLSHCDPDKLFKVATKLLIRWMKRNEPYRTIGYEPNE